MHNQLDFTEGKILKKMILFSLPMFFSNILQTSFQFIDSLWVGNLLGTTGLGAVSLSGPIIFTVLSFVIGLNGATLTVLSQARGAKDERRLKESLNAFVVVNLMLSGFFGVVGFLFTEQILRLMSTPESIMPLAKAYLQIHFVGILFLFGYNFIATVLRALGDSRTPVRFVLLSVALNAVFDPLFIHTFQLGIKGAAYATLFSQGTAFIYGVVHSLRNRKVPFTYPRIPAFIYIKTIMKLGVPAGLQMMVISGGVTAIMGIVASFGEDVVAGFGASQRIDSIIMIPIMTIGAAVTSMAGQNIGARLWERVNEIAKKGLVLILSISFFISLIVFLSADVLIRLFVSDKATIEFGAGFLKTVAFFYPFLGINFVLNGVVRAAGAMFQILVLNFISFWVLRVPLTYIFSNWLGTDGIAYGIGFSFVISSMFAAGYYMFGKWRSINLFAEKTN